MKSATQVILTETAIVVLSNGIFQTSIPLRQWTTIDGITWSSTLRQAHQIEWLMLRLRHSLNDSSHEPIMRRILRVLSDAGAPARNITNHARRNSCQRRVA